MAHGPHRVDCHAAASGRAGAGRPHARRDRVRGIPLGASFSESDTFVKVEDTGRVQTYELKTTDRTLGPATVDSMKFNTVDGKFARVMVRYSGKEAHDRILSYLQERFGPLDRHSPARCHGRRREVLQLAGRRAKSSSATDLRTSQASSSSERSLSCRVQRGQFALDVLMASPCLHGQYLIPKPHGIFNPQFGP